MRTLLEAVAFGLGGAVLFEVVASVLGKITSKATASRLLIAGRRALGEQVAQAVLERTTLLTAADKILEVGSQITPDPRLSQEATEQWKAAWLQLLYAAKSERARRGLLAPADSAKEFALRELHTLGDQGDIPLITLLAEQTNLSGSTRELARRVTEKIEQQAHNPETIRSN